MRARSRLTLLARTESTKQHILPCSAISFPLLVAPSSPSSRCPMPPNFVCPTADPPPPQPSPSAQAPSDELGLQAYILAYNTLFLFTAVCAAYGMVGGPAGGRAGGQAGDAVRTMHLT